MSALLLLLLAAHAQESDDSGWSTAGELRAILQTGTDFAVDDHGTAVGQGAHLDTRLRAGLSWTGTLDRFTTEWDFFSGQIAGDVWDIERSADERLRDRYAALSLQGIQPRKLSWARYVGNAEAEVGLQTSHWGMGLLANDGDHPPLFGREDFGDRVIRAKLTLLPFTDKLGAAAPTFVVFAIDTVYADELARLVDGQIATQAIAAILHDPGEDAVSAGAYGVFRNQLEPGLTRSTQAGVLDLYGRVPWALSAAWTLSVEAETVGILGTTSRAQSYASPRGLAVRAGAVAVRGELASEPVSLHLNGGLASGDRNPDDKVSQDFTADRDFGVGMVLFDEVLGNIDAGTHGLLANPEFSGQAPDGAELVATEGAWRRSAYLQPAVVVRPLDQVELRTGAVFAVATAPIAQPFYSFRNGGVPTNHLNQRTDGRALGTELDWAIAVSPLAEEDMAEWLFRPELELQGGHALLSEQLGGGVVTLVQGSARFRW